jgi:hypothetical protein
MNGLVELARRYVSLSDELESVREQIKREVLNGAGEIPQAPFVRAERPGAKGPQHPSALKAAAAEAKMLDLIRASPGMGTTALAKAAGSKTSTTIERLRRMRERGEVVGGGADGWTAPG